jgi:hypothetical protein
MNKIPYRRIPNKKYGLREQNLNKLNIFISLFPPSSIAAAATLQPTVNHDCLEKFPTHGYGPPVSFPNNLCIQMYTTTVSAF